MFAAVARFDIRFRWLIVVVWVAGVIAAARLLPSLASVTQANNVQFLSSSSLSVQAAALDAPFKSANQSGTAIIVASRVPGRLTGADATVISQVEQAVQGIGGVTLVRAAGTSQDSTTAEILVTVTAATAKSPTASKSVVDGIRASFSQVGAPAGLSFHLTGPVAVGVDSANTNNASAIARFTILFVIVLLFVVYRTVVAPLITLIPAGTFAVRGLAGGSSEAQELGFSIAFGVLLDTFFVRTLLVPSIAMLLGHWNWWPSALSRPVAQAPSVVSPGLAAGEAAGTAQSLPEGGRS